jgi:hypothetical protein
MLRDEMIDIADSLSSCLTATPSACMQIIANARRQFNSILADLESPVEPHSQRRIRHRRRHRTTRA